MSMGIRHSVLLNHEYGVKVGTNMKERLNNRQERKNNLEQTIIFEQIDEAPIEIDPQLEPENEQADLLISGSFWMTMGSFISRLLGALYIIPWMAWIGDAETGAAAHALYQVSYNPYAFFVSFAAAGIPSAIAKQVSFYNARGQYDISRKIYRQGMYMMIFSGIFSAILLYVLAPWLASTSPIADSQAASFVIRTLSPALLIIPIQAATRGFIQGHSRMKEPAISQMIEQLARVLFILGAVYIVRKVLNGEVVHAVGLSTFAAFVGAVASIIYLMVAMRRLPTALNQEEKQSTGQEDIATWSLLTDMIKTALPFVVIATGITIFQIIDQQTFGPLMHWLTDVSDKNIQLSYGIVQANAYKLSTLLVSFGASLSASSVPIISELVAQNELFEVRRQIERGFQLLLLIMIPLFFGMLVASGPLYTIFYSYSKSGTIATQIFALVSIFMALYLYIGNQLQAINERRQGIYALLAGFVAKLITQPLTVWLLQSYGMLISTMIGLIVTLVMMIHILNQRVGFSFSLTLPNIFKMMISSIAMWAGVSVVAFGLSFVFNVHSRIFALLALIVIGVVGIAIYGVICMKNGLIDELMSSVAEKVRRKFGRL